ncbi:hypothetical protein D3C77_719250 [compost metagenome]
MVGLSNNLRGERSPASSAPRLNWLTHSTMKNTTARARPCSPKAYRLIGKPRLPVLENRKAGTSTRQS